MFNNAMKNIDSTRKIPAGSTLRAYIRGYGYALVRVIDIHDRYLAVQCDGNVFFRAKHGDFWDLYLWVEQTASFDFTSQVIGSITVGDPVLFLSHSDTIIRRDERRCLKASVDIAVYFFVLDTGDFDKSISTEDVVHYKGKILELSDREAVLESDEQLKTGILIKMHISIDGKNREIIAHIDKAEAFTNGWRYDVTYTGMSTSQREELLEYVFSVYRE